MIFTKTTGSSLVKSWMGFMVKIMNIFCKAIVISLMLVSCKRGVGEQIIHEEEDNVIISAFCDDNIASHIIPSKFISGKIYLSLGFIDRRDSITDSNIYIEIDNGTSELVIDSALVSSLDLPIKFGKKIKIIAPDNVYNGYEGDIIKNEPLKMVLLSDTIFIEKCYISNGLNILPMRYLPENKIININV